MSTYSELFKLQAVYTYTCIDYLSFEPNLSIKCTIRKKIVTKYTLHKRTLHIRMYRLHVLQYTARRYELFCENLKAVCRLFIGTHT